MTAESLLITYVQVGVAIAGFPASSYPREPRAGRVVLPRPPALVCPARDERRVRTTQAPPLVLASTGLAEPTVWSASSGCSWSCNSGSWWSGRGRLSATRTRSPESGGSSPWDSPAGWCAWRRSW